MNADQNKNILEELLSLLKLEKIEQTIFRGQSQDLGFGNLFGGQVLGQSLSAAYQTMNPNFNVNSLHGYFLLPGDVKLPIVYTVDCTRDGNSFATRRVLAVQKGRAIFSLSASFQKTEEGYNHQNTMPAIEGPEGIISEIDLAQKYSAHIPPKILEKLLCRKPIEIRIVNPVNPFNPAPMPPEKFTWFKAIGPLPDDPAIHRYMLAYASDFHLTSTSLYPHGKTYWNPNMQVASLDHSLWFHRDFRMDQWLLHVMKSPNASGGRGLSFGSIYTQDGKLVATTAQEGLIRNRKNN